MGALLAASLVPVGARSRGVASASRTVSTAAMAGPGAALAALAAGTAALAAGFDWAIAVSLASFDGHTIPAMPNADAMAMVASAVAGIRARRVRSRCRGVVTFGTGFMTAGAGSLTGVASATAAIDSVGSTLGSAVTMVTGSGAMVVTVVMPTAGLAAGAGIALAPIGASSYTPGSVGVRIPVSSASVSVR